MLRPHQPDASEPSEPGSCSGQQARESAGQHGQSLLGRALVGWTRLCLRAPLAVVLTAVISAVAAGFWTTQSLGYKVSRVDLLDPKSDYNKLWIDYVQEFGEDDDAVVVV